MLPQDWKGEGVATAAEVDLNELDGVKFDGISVRHDGTVIDGDGHELDWPTVRHLMATVLTRIDRLVKAAEEDK